jgi:hypothetical protein
MDFTSVSFGLDVLERHYCRRTATSICPAAETEPIASSAEMDVKMRFMAATVVKAGRWSRSRSTRWVKL